MHICFTAVNYGSRLSGGRNSSLEYISRELQKRGYAVTVVSTPSGDEFALKEDNVIYTPPLRTPKSLTGIYQIYKATVKAHKKQEIDVIHACNREIAGLAGLLFRRKYNVPLVVWMYDLGFESQKLGIKALRNPLYKIYFSVFNRVAQSIVLKHCDAITSIGPDITALLKKNEVYRHKIFEIGNTTDTEKFSPRVDTGRIRKEFSIGNASLITCVGTLNPVKGPDIFIKAASYVSEVIKNVKFLVVGSAIRDRKAYERSLHQMAKDLQLGDKVIFTGVRYDVPEIMAASDCVVVTPRKMGGGIGNVWLETMASETPLVTSNVASAEYVIRNYENGIIVADENPYEAAKAVINILTDKELAKKIGGNARLTVIKEHSIEATVDKLLDVYQTMKPK